MTGVIDHLMLKELGGLSKSKPINCQVCRGIFEENCQEVAEVTVAMNEKLAILIFGI